MNLLPVNILRINRHYCFYVYKHTHTFRLVKTRVGCPVRIVQSDAKVPPRIPVRTSLGGTRDCMPTYSTSSNS